VVELDRSAIDGLAARVLESGMAPAVGGTETAYAPGEHRHYSNLGYCAFTG
jgi:hypothetical protein